MRNTCVLRVDRQICGLDYGILVILGIAAKVLNNYKVFKIFAVEVITCIMRRRHYFGKKNSIQHV